MSIQLPLTQESVRAVTASAPAVAPAHATPEAEEGEEEDDNSDSPSDDYIGDDACEADDDENPNDAYDEGVYPF